MKRSLYTHRDYQAHVTDLRTGEKRIHTFSGFTCARDVIDWARKMHLEVNGWML